MKKLILLILFIIPAQVSALNLFQIGIGLTSEIVTLPGGGTITQYTYTFNLENLGPDPDEIFKWEFSNGSSKWTTVGTTVPEGWTANAPSGNKIMEMTANGSGSMTRILVGETLPFTWTFTIGSGPLPMTEWGGSVHFQPVGSEGENVGETYKVTTPVPEPATLLLMGFGLTGLALYRRFSKKINKN